MDFASATILLLVFAVTCLALMYEKMLRVKHQLPPGPMPLPLIGNLHQLRGSDTVRSLVSLHKQYGPLYTVFLGNRPCLVICGYEAMKDALIDQAEEFGGRGEFPVFLNYTKGHEVAFNNGEKWKELRRFALLTLRNFGMGKRSVEERIQEEAQYLVEEFKKTKMAPTDPTVFFSRTVSNIICSIVFGSRFDYEDKRLLTIVNSMNESFQIISSKWGMLYNTYPGIMHYLPGCHQKIFENFEKIKEVILDRLKTHLETHDPSCPRDYMDCFITRMEAEKKNPSTVFYYESLLMSILTLLFAGTETISTTLRYGFLMLMKYPKIAVRTQEEIDNVIGQSRHPSIEDRSKMPYTKVVIHEIQRFADVVPLNVPHMATCNTTLRGYSVPKGTQVIPLLTSVHYDATQFKDPYTFNPSRFLDGNGCFRKNDAVMPFSAGKRICLGESLADVELFLYFTTILQNFTFKPLVRPEEIDLTPANNEFGNLPPAYQCRFVPR